MSKQLKRKFSLLIYYFINIFSLRSIDLAYLHLLCSYFIILLSLKTCRPRLACSIIRLLFSCLFFFPRPARPVRKLISLLPARPIRKFILFCSSGLALPVRKLPFHLPTRGLGSVLTSGAGPGPCTLPACLRITVVAPRPSPIVH